MDNLNYGVIGNCKSAALVSESGNIEWCCLPDLDSPSIFAKLLDKNRGGEFGIEVSPDYKIEQQYASQTNIIVTTFSHGNNKFELIDFMPRYKTQKGKTHCPPDIIRYIRHVSGSPEIKIHYQPRPCYSQYEVKTEVRKKYIKTGTVNGSYESVYLYSDFDLPAIAQAESLSVTQDHYLLLSYNQKLIDMNIDTIQLEYEKTRVYWLDWSSRTTKVAQFRDQVNRSALVLKLLAYQNTGAISAAITTSIPEALGTGRNWDYRYCWIRDASMTVVILTKLNHYTTANRFLKFILSIIPYKDEKIQIVYGIKEQKKLTEKQLDFLDGYENSKPVRIGNAAYTQKQNDIFGILLDVIHQYLTTFRRGTLHNKEELWTVVRTLARHVERNWTKPDMGIWEFRTQKKHFVFSKVLSWVAMDRGVKIADIFGMDSYVQAWSELREKIREDILQKGWNEEIQAFTQSYENMNLDAANLLMEYYGFIDADDPKYISTVNLTKERLCKDGLMYRYINEDDFGKPRSSFTVCTFWLIKSLHRIGQKEVAEEMFKQVLSYSNHLGLFSEDIDFETKRLLGNFPQGYSHLALVDAAMTISGDTFTPDSTGLSH